MKPTTRRVFVLAPAVLLMGTALQAANFSTEPAPALPDGLSADIAALLDPNGIAVKGADGSAVAEYWARNAEFDGEPVSGFGIRFDHMPEGALIGVVRLQKRWSDFRTQGVAPGVYTLRYGLHPEDGNHMGVASSRDFALLTPAEHDSEPAKNYSFDQLVELSAKAGNPHPTIVRLELPEGDDHGNLWVNDYGHSVLDLMVGGMTVGVVVHGHADE